MFDPGLVEGYVEYNGPLLTTNRNPDFVPPKKPYSFTAMLDDILNFASDTLVDDGRLSFWMPTANDEDQEIAVPTHPCLEIVIVCTQAFTRCKFNHLIVPCIRV